MQQLDAAHEAGCPWKGNTCDRGLGVFPALPAAAMLRSWQAAAKALSRLTCLPPLKAQELQAILGSHRRGDKL